MKNLISVLVMVILLCFTLVAPVAAQEVTTRSDVASKIYGLYLEPKVGVTAFVGEYLQRNGKSGSSGTDSAAGIGGGLSVGYDWWFKTGLPIRTEVEYVVRSNANMEVGNRSYRAVAPQTVFANTYFDFHNDTDFTPYVGGGIGAAFVGYDSNFAWNVGSGVAYKINDNMSATLGYRFVSFGKVEENHCKGLLYGHEALVGLRYTF